MWRPRFRQCRNERCIVKLRISASKYLPSEVGVSLDRRGGALQFYACAQYAANSCNFPILVKLSVVTTTNNFDAVMLVIGVEGSPLEIAGVSHKVNLRNVKALLRLTVCKPMWRE